MAFNYNEFILNDYTNEELQSIIDDPFHLDDFKKQCQNLLNKRKHGHIIQR